MHGVFDLHCDTILRLVEGGRLAGMEGGHLDIPRLRRGGSLAQCFAIFVPPDAYAPEAGPDGPDRYVKRAYGAFLREMEANREDIRQARSLADIEENRRAGRLSAVLTVEDAVSLDGKLERLDGYAAMGVKMAALLWNHENALGYPNSPDSAKHALGLKPFGLEAVERMEELGIAVDVSHLSEGGFWDVVRVGKKPFVASHSCARALRNHPRNLTDEQLRAVADRGGVVGINFCAAFLHDRTGEEEKYTSMEDIARHLLHMKKVAGGDILALGSDFDGIDSRLEFGDFGGMEALERALGRWFTAAELEAIGWKNAWRTFGEIWG